MGTTQNDPRNLSYIHDMMAFWATSSIAQVGYVDNSGQEAQIYPKDSLWGSPANGNYCEYLWLPSIVAWIIPDRLFPSNYRQDHLDMGIRHDCWRNAVQPQHHILRHATLTRLLPGTEPPILLLCNS